LAVVLLNGLVRLLYGQRVTDEATCYKAFRTSLLRDMNLQAQRFEFCPEVTAKACRMGCQILEVPISYSTAFGGRGKKIRFGDGFEAAWTLLRWRFSGFRTLVRGPESTAAASSSTVDDVWTPFGNLYPIGTIAMRKISHLFMRLPPIGIGVCQEQTSRKETMTASLLTLRFRVLVAALMLAGPRPAALGQGGGSLTVTATSGAPAASRFRLMFQRRHP